MKQKKVVAVLLTLAMTAAFAQAVSAEPAGETVTMMGWYDEDDMQGVIDAVNEKLDGKYTLEYMYVTQADYSNVLGTQLASGEGPDVVFDGAEFPARVKAGNVVAITDKDYVKNFSEEGLSLASSNGEIYGLPAYGWFCCMWYNKDILEKAGVTEIPTTREELLAACEKVQEAGYQPMGFGLADGDTARNFLNEYLENSFYRNNEANPDGIEFDTKFAKNEVTMNGNINPQVEKWSEYISKGYITEEMLGISNQDALNSFKNGDVAFFYGGPWQYNELKESGINFGTLQPLGDQKDDVIALGGPSASFGINVNASNPEGAEAAVEALASVEVQQAFADANTGAFSYCEGVQTSLPEEYDGIAPYISEGAVACNWDRWSINMPSQSLIDDMRQQIQGMITGDLSVDDFCTAMDEKADSIRYE